MRYKLIAILIIILIIGCTKNNPTDTDKADTQAPTVSILFPGSGSDVKADTTYTIIADANDNIGVTRVDFYISGIIAGSDSLSPYEYRWSTQGLTGSPTIMAKAYDEAGNIGTSVVITVRINGAANHPPTVPSNPTPADSSIGQPLSPTLRWSCSDPDGDALNYDVFFDTSKSPTTQVATRQSTATITLTELSLSTKYYWKIVAKDNRGGISTGPVWSFTTATNNPPTVPSNPNPSVASTDVSILPILSWSCSDPDGDVITYDVFFDTNTPPITQVATGQSGTTLPRTGLSLSTKYYWKVNAKDSKGATTSGIVWSFTTTNPPVVPSNPNPTNASTGISTSSTLSWNCSDPDGDSLSYDIFFGTSNPPFTQVATGQSAATFAFTGLSNGTTYYWKVNAKDSKGATTNGPVWSFTTSVIPPSMVAVAGGTFTMGSNDAKDNGASPPHSVTIGLFNIDKYEVTYEKWTDIYNWGLTHGYTDLPSGGNGYNPNGTNNPVTNVNWYDILKWCNARSEKDGLTPSYYTDNTQSNVYRTGQLDLVSVAVKWTSAGYRLPTEAEWEFAARGGNSSQGYTYSGSNVVGDVAWYSSNAGNGTHTVGTKSANELGIYDMSGNVWEWNWDWYGAYSSTTQTDPKGATSGQGRGVRGGSFYNGGVVDYCRVAYRFGAVDPHSRMYGVADFGFRCVQK